MNLQRLAAVLIVLLVSFWIDVPEAQAFCMDDYDCLANQQCIDSQCQNPGTTNPPPSTCIPSGGIDDTLYRTHCCSGQAVPGSTYCINPADYYNGTWASCSHICA